MGRRRWLGWCGRRSDDDFAEEIESHLAMEEERLGRMGMSADEAHFAARRAFGNATVRREDFHESRAGFRIESLAQDVRYGLRSMRHTPAFTAIAVASFAIGIGANTTMFGAVDGLLVRTPDRVRDADRIHRIYFEMPGRDGQPALPWSYQGYKTYVALRDSVKAFESVAAYWTQKVSSGRGVDARSIDAVAVTPSWFPMLGVRPALGRFFLPTEERDETDHVAVLGYDAWRGWYNGDSSVLGHTIDVAGLPYIIVGVAPRRFTGVDVNRVDLWLPLGVSTRLLSPKAMDPRMGGFWLEIAAKGRAGVPVGELASEATRVYRSTWRDVPRYEMTFGKSTVLLGSIIAARGPAPSADATVSRWVAAVSFLVLLIASANVANLLLLRGLTRSREVALRLSLGATRWRIARQWLVEGALLATAGAIAAIVLARWTASAMLRFLVPRAADDGILSVRLLLFTAIVALGTGIVASIVPAFVTARRNFASLLGTGRAVGGPTRLALQRALLGGQVALATLLIVGAGLFVISLRNVQAIDLGLDVDHVLYVQPDFASVTKRTRDPNANAATNASYRAMLEQVRRVPGVVSATFSAGSALGEGSAISLQRRGAPPLSIGAPVPFLRAVGPNYFETMGTSLIRGRYFTAADHQPNARVAIVDEGTAKQYQLDGNGLDPCVYLGSRSDCTEVVGIVKNSVLWQITGDKGSIVYLPYESGPEMPINTMEVRTAGDPTELIPAIRRAALSASSDLPWLDITPLSDRVAPQLKPWRLGASMFTAFGVLALCLAAVGLYGLLSYTVTRRTQEIGIRKALGAPTGGVVRMVLRDALGMTIAGASIGVVAALAAGRLVASQLYGVSAHDPTVIAVSVVALVVVAIVASLAPAIRAARVDPLVALRTE
jgi:predicted permease